MNFDDELAAAAGRADDSNAKRERDVSISDDDEAQEENKGDDGDDDNDEDYEEAPKGGRKGRPVPLKKRRVGESDEDEEEGEESEDDEDDDEDDEFGDGYDKDLYKDDDDRERLARMTELDREMILADRAEERDKLKERRRNAMQAQKAAVAAKSDKKKAKVSKERARKEKEHKEKEKRDKEIEAMYVRTSTRRVGKESAKETALQALQKTREGRKERSGTRVEKARAKQQEEPESDDEDAELSDVGSEGMDNEGDLSPERYDDQDRSRYQDEDEEVEDATYQEACTVLLTRSRLEKWCNEVFFEETVPHAKAEGSEFSPQGCLVRVAVGEENGETQYVVAQIDRIEQHDRENTPLRNYFISKGGAKTNKYMNCKRGNANRQFQMSLVSNRVMTPQEFAGWQKFCSKTGADFMTRADVNRIREQLKKGEGFKYTSEDVKKMVLAKKERGTHAVNIIVERDRLKNLIAHAEMNGTASEADGFRAELEELEQRAKQKEERRQMTNKGDLGSINKRSKAHNYQELHEAGQEEMVKAKVGGWGGDLDDGAFARRKTRPMTYWKTKAGEEEKAKKEAAAKKKDNEELSVDEIRRRKAEDLEKTLEDLRKIPLDIDISRLQEPTLEGQLAKRLLGRAWEQSVAKYSDESLVAAGVNKWDLATYLSGL